MNLDFVFPALNDKIRWHLSAELERQEISNLVKNRMEDLGYGVEDYGKCKLLFLRHTDSTFISLLFSSRQTTSPRSAHHFPTS